MGHHFFAENCGLLRTQCAPRRCDEAGEKGSVYLGDATRGQMQRFSTFAATIRLKIAAARSGTAAYSGSGNGAGYPGYAGSHLACRQDGRALDIGCGPRRHHRPELKVRGSVPTFGRVVVPDMDEQIFDPCTRPGPHNARRQHRIPPWRCLRVRPACRGLRSRPSALCRRSTAGNPKRLFVGGDAPARVGGVVAVAGARRLDTQLLSAPSRVAAAEGGPCSEPFRAWRRRRLRNWRRGLARSRLQAGLDDGQYRPFSLCLFKVTRWSTICHPTVELALQRHDWSGLG